MFKFISSVDNSLGTYGCKYGVGVLLNQNNYRQWRSDIVNFLEADGTLDIVTGKEPPPKGVVALREYRKRVGRARGLVSTSCDSTTRLFITGIHDPAKAWAELENMFDISANQPVQLALWGNLLLTPIDSCSSSGISDFIAKANSIRFQLHDTPAEISDEIYICILLAKLPKAAKQIKEVIELQPTEVKTVTYITNTLVKWEIGENSEAGGSTNPSNTMNNTVATYSSRGNQYRSDSRGSSRGNSGYRVDKNNSSGSPNNNQKTSNIHCFHCGRKGHKREGCRIKKRGDSCRRKAMGW